jgi:hypothetical protein
MDIKQYIEIRRKVSTNDVSLGYQTVRLFPVDELDEAQQGYSITESGETLIGTDEDAWKSNWLVIASDELVGDPIFVDLDENDLPVYTAEHGEGIWNPVIVSSSFNGFIQALEEIDRIAQGRRNPVEFERNPVSDTDRKQSLNRIAEACGDTSIEFWESWFDV